MDFTIYANNVCLNLRGSPWWYSLHTFTDVFTEATEYSDYLKGREPVDITDRLLPNPEIWSQKPPETVPEIEKLKIFLGEHTPRSP